MANKMEQEDKKLIEFLVETRNKLNLTQKEVVLSLREK